MSRCQCFMCRVRVGVDHVDLHLLSDDDGNSITVTVTSNRFYSYLRHRFVMSVRFQPREKVLTTFPSIDRSLPNKQGRNTHASSQHYVESMTEVHLRHQHTYQMS